MAGKRTPLIHQISVPPKWGLTRITIHYEGEDLSADDDPFAANIAVELRTDIRPGFSLADVAAADLVSLKATVPEVEVLGTGEITIQRASFQHLEVVVKDPSARSFRQLLIYVPRGNRVYTVAGTHVAERFDAVRSAITTFAASLLPDGN